MQTLESLQKEIDELKKQNKLILDTLGKLVPIDNQIESDSGGSQTIPAGEIEELKKPPLREEAQLVSKKEDTQKIKLEEKIGKKWFALVGILAMVIGIGFFIKYLSDSGYIGPIVRIMIGILVSLGLIIFGQIISKRERYANWGRVLIGGGLAAIYFIVYASYNFIEYREALSMTQGLDIFLLFIVALSTIGLSIKNNSQIIASEAFILGLVTVLLGADFGVLMLVYNLFLLLVIVAVVAYKKWLILGLWATFGTYFTYAIWRMDNNNFSLAITFLIIYFLCYVIQSILISLQSKNSTLDNKNIGIIIVNSVLFFIAGLELIRNFYPNYDALFCLLLAIFHLGAYFVARFSSQKKISQIYFYFTAAFLAIAIPLYFEKSLITIAWSVLGLVLLLSYLKTNYRPMEYVYYVISVMIGWKVLLFDSSLHSFAWNDLLGSTRALAFLFAAACFYLGYYFLMKNREKISPAFREMVPYLYSFFPTFLLVILPLIELVNNSQWVTVYWSVLFVGSIAVYYFLKSSEFRLISLVIGLIIAMKILYFDFIYKYGMDRVVDDYYFWVYLATAVIFYGASVLFYWQKKLSPSSLQALPVIYSWLASLVLFLLIWMRFSNYRISAGWAIMALILVILGFVIRKKELRYQGIVILGITVFKVFLYDTSELEAIYRTLSFIILGLILLTASFLYNKYKEKIDDIL